MLGLGLELKLSALVLILGMQVLAIMKVRQKE